MSRIRLIDKPECPFCWRVRIAAALQGRAMHSMDRSDPDVLVEWQRLSPSQTVPVMIEDDLVLTDSGPMLEYLAETGPALLPDSPRRRAEARSWIVYGIMFWGDPCGKWFLRNAINRRANGTKAGFAGVHADS